jgi:hypothetical protein
VTANARCAQITPEPSVNSDVAKGSVDLDRKFCKTDNANLVNLTMWPQKIRPQVLCQNVIACRNCLEKDFAHIVQFIKLNHLMVRTVYRLNATISRA